MLILLIIRCNINSNFVLFWQTICFFKDMVRGYFIILILLASPLFHFSILGQQLFQLNDLRHPLKNGETIAAKFQTVEVYEYQIPTENVIVLRNGFRKHGFINSNEWLEIKDSAKISKVQVVFSKYPLRNGTYNEIYPLLLNRIQETISLDPALNDTSILWERVWQTHCENNAQVDKLFHGVVIHYTPTNNKTTPSNSIKKNNSISSITIGGSQGQSKASPPLVEEKKMSAVLEYMLNHPTTPESLRLTAKELSTEEAERLVLNYYREEAKTLPEGPITEPAVQLNYMYELEVFARQFPETDSVVSEVLDRHPEWNKKIVINDWTGSMYGYGSQVILWHLMNLDKSGISKITLFNDGDKKPTHRKKIGKTKGIYSSNADQPSEILDLFNTVMKKGGGGDGPENDVEAILKAIEDTPESEVILIADNSACVRDISLAYKINRPVRIILCGYNPEEGVNPDYVYLAKITNGGIYTMEDDLEQLSATVNQGLLETFQDNRFKLSSPQCFEDVFYATSGRLYHLKKAKWHKKDVRVLDASNMLLNDVPKYVYKMPNLQSLNLQKNFLTKIDDRISNLTKLSELDLSNNILSILPESIERNRFIEHLYIDNNQFEAIPKRIYELNFLKEISCKGNQIPTLHLFKSKTIIAIDASDNKIHELPNLESLKTLEILKLSENQIDDFPKHLPSENLLELDLSFNNISELPDDLTSFTSLKKLNLQGNPVPTGERIRIRQALFNVDVRF